jgi:anti-anti-sigma regulatory factor
MNVEVVVHDDKNTRRVVVTFVGDVLTPTLPEKLQDLLDAAAGRVVHFDFAKTKRINSVGVRSLLLMCKEASSLAPLNYVRCVPEVTDQFSLLPEFLRYGRVHSLLVTESCPVPHTFPARSGPVQRELVLGRDLLMGSGEPTVVPVHCSVCGTELERTTHDELLFAFLKPSGLQRVS